MDKESFGMMLGAAVLGGLVVIVTNHVFTGSAAYAQQRADRVVRAEKLEIIDQAGKVRVKIDVVDNMPSIRFDPDEKNEHHKIWLGVGQAGAAFLSMADQEGKSRVQLGLAPNQSKEARLILNDEHEKARVWLATGKDGEAKLSLRNAEENTTASLQTTEEGEPRLVFFGKSGREKAMLALDAHTEESFLQLYGKNEEPRVTLRAHNNKGEIYAAQPKAPEGTTDLPVTAGDANNTEPLPVPVAKP